jgi:hypothetical protein
METAVAAACIVRRFQNHFCRLSRISFVSLSSRTHFAKDRNPRGLTTEAPQALAATLGRACNRRPPPRLFHRDIDPVTASNRDNS